MAHSVQGEDYSMECMYCQGTMKRDIAPFHVDRKGYHLTFDVVPAWVCIQCGEVYFEDTKIGAIQEVIQTIEQQTHEMMLVPHSHIKEQCLARLQPLNNSSLQR